MKLVDILARELKEWPVEAVAIAQDCDGSAHPYDSDDLEFNHGEWGGENAGAQIASYKVTVGGNRAEDYSTAIITRAKWQEARDALNKPAVEEWNGEGLPPIGAICEYAHPGDDFDKCLIEAYIKNKVVFTCPDYAMDPEAVFIAEVGKPEFRKIRTPEQIAAEERERAISDIAKILAGGGEPDKMDIGDAGLVYDAGYRKQEQKPE